MTSSTSRTEAIEAYPILTYLSLRMDDEELHNLELDIKDGKLDLKESDTPYEGTPPQQMERIQEIAIQLKILCSAISLMKANGDDLNYKYIAINLKSLRETLLDRVDVLNKNPGVSVELDKIESQLSKMQMPSLLPPGIKDYNEARPFNGFVVAHQERPQVNGLTHPRNGARSRSIECRPPPPRSPGIQPYRPLLIYRPEKSDVPEEKIEVPTKESLTDEILESLQKREKGETVCSSSRSTEMSPITESQLFQRAVDYTDMDYIQKLHEKETDPTLKNSLYHLRFKLLFPEIE